MPHTLVSFHAHPDDEAIATGGTMAKAADEGHRVVLVVATKGEEGEIVPGVLREGEQLWERRVEETHRAAEALGVARVEFLGYRDSGMMDTATNTHPDCFWRADVDEAAAKLAAILEQERADVFTCYDDHGGYGHPDHIQVHRVGVRAAELAGTKKVYESTMNRDQITAMIMAAPEELRPEGFDEESLAEFGSPEEALTTRVDVAAFTDRKREAMQAHASQIAESSFFLSLPADLFTLAFGTEWFILRGAPEGTAETDVFDGLST